MSFNKSSGSAGAVSLVVQDTFINKGTLTQQGDAIFTGNVIFTKNVIFRGNAKKEVVDTSINTEHDNSKTLNTNYEKNMDQPKTKEIDIFVERPSDLLEIKESTICKTHKMCGNHYISNIFLGSETKILESYTCNILMCFPFDIEIYAYSLIGDNVTLENWPDGDCKLLIMNRSQIFKNNVSTDSVHTLNIPYDKKNEIWISQGDLGRTISNKLDKPLLLKNNEVVTSNFISGNFIEPCTIACVLFWREI